MKFFKIIYFLPLIVNCLCVPIEVTDCEKTHLDLSKRELTEVPKIIPDCIKSLDLSNNNLTGFEEGVFDGLKNLEHLDLSKNFLDGDNKFGFGSHPNLRSLVLDNNFVGYTYNPLSVNYNYPNLKELSLRFNHIKFLPEEEDLNERFPKLEKLDLSENALHSQNYDLHLPRIPKSVKHLTIENQNNLFFSLNTTSEEYLRFETLVINNNDLGKISRNHSLCEHPDYCLYTTNFVNLKTLSASNCYLRTAEKDSFKDFKNLVNLDLSNNGLHLVPSDMFADMSALEVLDISNTKMVDIPNISNLKNLRKLYANNVRNVASLIYQGKFDQPLEKLEVLSLTGNNLKSINKEFLANFPNLKNPEY